MIQQALAREPALDEGTLRSAVDERGSLHRLVVVAYLDADVHELGEKIVARLALVQRTMKRGITPLRSLLDVRPELMMMSSQHGFPFPGCLKGARGCR